MLLCVRNTYNVLRMSQNNILPKRTNFSLPNRMLWLSSGVWISVCVCEFAWCAMCMSSYVHDFINKTINYYPLRFRWRHNWSIQTQTKSFHVKAHRSAIYCDDTRSKQSWFISSMFVFHVSTGLFYNFFYCFDSVSIQWSVLFSHYFFHSLFQRVTQYL